MKDKLGERIPKELNEIEYLRLMNSSYKQEIEELIERNKALKRQLELLVYGDVSE